MNNNSWHILEHQATEFQLPNDLSQNDVFKARDCGWVEQMRPFIRQFSAPGELVLDPFCGFGTTLVAAGLEGRLALGTEIDRERATLAQQRLIRLGMTQQRVLSGSSSELAASLPEVSLILTSVPYFGCHWPGDKQLAEQCYASPNYDHFLELIRRTFAALKSVLKPHGFLIVMAENVRLQEHFVPVAWDIAQLLTEHYVMLDERVLLYRQPTTPLSGPSDPSNRAHEYALIAQKRPKPVDLMATRVCLQDFATEFSDFIVYGSFAQWLAQPMTATLPSNANLLIPADAGYLSRIMHWLSAYGFRLTHWGTPLTAPLLSTAMTSARYLRAEYLQASGQLCVIDVSFEDDHQTFANLKPSTIFIDGLPVFIPELLQK